MADLAGLPWFHLEGNYRGVVPDTLDKYQLPDVFRPWAEVTITPAIARPDNKVDVSTPELRLTEFAPPLTVVLTPTIARIETGVLRLPRLNAPAGETDPPTQTDIDEQNAAAGVELLANAPALQLSEGHRLVWRVDFGPMKINGVEYRYNGFWFEGPVVDDFGAEGWTPPALDLTTVERFVPTT